MRNRLRVAMAMVLGGALAGGEVSQAQNVPAVLTAVPPVSTSYVPKRTPWGDPDFRATWTTDRIVRAGIPLQRPVEMGDRLWLTQEEFTRRLEAAKKRDAEFKQDVEATGTIGLAEWVRSTPFARRSSLIVSPPNGRLPPLTPGAQVRFKAGRSSWNKGQAIDWVSDLDTYDRCITRGFPNAMFPRGGNDGIRVFQSPGFVVLQLEMLGTRIIPIDYGARWPTPVRAWMGQSLGHWEGSTLVIETADIVAGDGAGADAAKHAAPPISVDEDGLMPTGEKAKTVERLTMTGPSTIEYQVTYSDPDVFTAPWTVEIEWSRDDNYQMYEYACHEGNEVRELITSSRAQRKKDAAAAAVGQKGRK